MSDNIARSALLIQQGTETSQTKSLRSILGKKVRDKIRGEEIWKRLQTENMVEDIKICYKSTWKECPLTLIMTGKLYVPRERRHMG
jgi:hypothetical protein